MAAPKKDAAQMTAQLAQSLMQLAAVVEAPLPLHPPQPASLAKAAAAVPAKTRQKRRS